MPTEETKELIKKVTHIHNEVDEYGDLKEPAIHILNAEEREDREAEVRRIENQLSQPAWVNNRISSERRGDMLNRAKDLKKQLAKYAPPDQLSGEAKDELYRLQQDLEEKIKVGMLPTEVMRRNPGNAVDRHMAWEKKAKPWILIWKNIVRMLNPNNKEVDLSNVERLRPSMAMPGGAATFMGDAKIPGNFAMTPLAKENWPEGMPEYGTVDTPMKQAERREAEEIKALQQKIADLEAVVEFNRKKKQRARERMANARAAKGKKATVEDTPSAA